MGGQPDARRQAADDASDPRLSVTVELGMTLPVTDYGNVRPRVTINNIDPYGDVDEQVSVALKTATRAFGLVDGEMINVISNILAPETGLPGFRERLEAVETGMRNLNVARENLKRVVSRLKELGERVDVISAEVKGGGK